MEEKKIGIKFYVPAHELTRKEFLDACEVLYNEQLEKARRKGIVTDRYFRVAMMRNKENLLNFIQEREKVLMSEMNVSPEKTMYYVKISPDISTLAAYVMKLKNNKGEYSLQDVTNYKEALDICERIYKYTATLWEKDFKGLVEWSLHEFPFDENKDFSASIDRREVRKRIASIIETNQMDAGLVTTLASWYICFFPCLYLARKNELRKREHFSAVSIDSVIPKMVQFLNNEIKKREKKMGVK